MWYAAHVILLTRFEDGLQDTYPVWENIILIEAESGADAWEKAEAYGTNDAADSHFRLNNRDAHWEFVGVRKVLECYTAMDPNERKPGEHEENGVEVTYSAFTLKTEADVKRLIDNQAVSLIYERALGGEEDPD